MGPRAAPLALSRVVAAAAAASPRWVPARSRRLVPSSRARSSFGPSQLEPEPGVRYASLTTTPSAWLPCAGPGERSLPNAAASSCSQRALGRLRLQPPLLAPPWPFVPREAGASFPPNPRPANPELEREVRKSMEGRRHKRGRLGGRRESRASRRTTGRSGDSPASQQVLRPRSLLWRIFTWT